MTIRVDVVLHRDHLNRVAYNRPAAHSIVELVWNALDAEAYSVKVEVKRNNIDGLTEIVVTDDGHGMTPTIAEQTFRDFGESWKAKAKITKNGRLLHGQKGEGRYSAFGLGDCVTWRTRFQQPDGTFGEFTISGHRNHLKAFDLSAVTPSAGPAGTTVTITEFTKQPKGIDFSVGERLTEALAVFLEQHASVRVWYDGRLVDPSLLALGETTLRLDGLLDDDAKPIFAGLKIIEWRRALGKEIFLCDAHGASLRSLDARIHAPGFHFTAYVLSDYVRDLHTKGHLELPEMHSGLQKLLEACRRKARDHFREQAAARSQSVVEGWKADDVYPYSGAPKDPLETVERQVFDIVALNVNEYLPEFSESPAKSKRFSLRMLKSALEQSPSELRRIVQEVLDLPDDKRAELAALLERTSLTAIINASKLIVDRLEFLVGLEDVIFNPVSKELLKERSQLHKLLGENPWIFGEQFAVSSSDEGLKAVLDAHLGLLRKDLKKVDPKPVAVPVGTRSIIDLMLSRQMRLGRAEEFEHLVVELKRPNVDITTDVLTQIENYAIAVINDERFKDAKVRWTFWVVCNDMNDFAREKATSVDRPRGMVMRHPRGEVWAKTWSEVLEDCRGRLEFFRDKLKYMATTDAGLAHLQAVYSQYLPEELGGAQKSKPKKPSAAAAAPKKAAPGNAPKKAAAAKKPTPKQPKAAKNKAAKNKTAKNTAAKKTTKKTGSPVATPAVAASVGGPSSAATSAPVAVSATKKAGSKQAAHGN